MKITWILSIIFIVLLVSATADLSALQNLVIATGDNNPLPLTNIALPTADDEPTPEGCDICKGLIDAITKQALDDPEELRKNGKLYCASAHAGDAKKEKKCSDLVDLMIPLLPHLIKGLRELAWNSEAFCSTILNQCLLECCDTQDKPEQIFMTFGESIHDRTLVWTTLGNFEDSSYLLIQDSPDFDAPKKYKAVMKTYTTSGWRGHIYHATVLGLAPKTRYYYKVGHDNSWSDVMSFRTLAPDVGSSKTPLRMIQIADIDLAVGEPNFKSIEKLLMQPDTIHMVLLIGDVGYVDGYERRWDTFARKIQQVITRHGIPFHTSPGNHEFWNNFEGYSIRYPRTHKHNELYYSLRFNNIHLQVLSGESSINTPNVDQFEQQWAKEDLAKANQAKVDWIITAMHRPLYCTSDTRQCYQFSSILQQQVENIWVDNGVDLVMHGHMHAYERTHQMYQGKPFDQGEGGKHYKKNGVPLYVVNGAGGNRENFRSPRCDEPWSALCLRQQGFAVVTASPTELSYRFLDPNNEDATLDYFTIRK